MESPSTSLVSTKEVDYLDEDPELRGQKYVCLSFLSPENELKNKEVYFFSKFIEKFSTDMETLLTSLVQKYPDQKELIDQIRENNANIFQTDELENQYKFFKSIEGPKLEESFHAMNNFTTTIRGIKVRGVFETLNEAQIRAQVLKKKGDKFDIFIGQVGVWCPWSPNPEEMNQEFGETQLNTLMKKYQENMSLRDELFEQRKQQKLNAARSPVSVLPDAEKDDPWTATHITPSDTSV